MKSTVLKKVQRKLSNNYPDYEYDEELLGDYFDDAISIIIDWKRLSNTNIILTGKYDTNIQQFIIESIGKSGIEGQISNTANGITKNYSGTPESHLKSSILQSL